MVNIFGKNYYIDIDGITEKCRTTQQIIETDGTDESDATEESDGSIEINIFKYEIIKMCLERLLNDVQEIDEEMGVFAQNDTSISFKIAFNTLIKNQILIEDDE
jgi:hypothetical protein